MNQSSSDSTDRYVVVRDSCATPRFEVWDSVTEEIVAAYADEDHANEVAEALNEEAG